MIVFLKKLLSPKQKKALSLYLSKIRLFFYKKNVGKNTYIDKTVHVTGWKNISIGSNTGISEGTWINVNGREPNTVHIVIGDHCHIGRRNFFSSGLLIRISDYFMSGMDCKMIGADHVVNNPLLPYVSTGSVSKGQIIIEPNVWLGAGVTIIGNITVARGSVIGAGSLVNTDIPPFSIAVGNPCKVIKRFAFDLGEWVKAEEYDIKSDSYIPNELDYLTELKKSHVTVPFPACGKAYGDLL